MTILRTFFFCILLCTLCYTEESDTESPKDPPKESDTKEPPKRKMVIVRGPSKPSKLIRRTLDNKNPLDRCVNGKVNEAGRCICPDDYVGRHCERKKMCSTFRRYRNGTCVSCQSGYSGPFCEDIICEHGRADPTGLKCVCDKPFIGEFCRELNTANVYSYYNNKVFALGPLGALSIIPMCLVLHFCEKYAQKRQVARVGEWLGTDLEHKQLAKLLKNDV